MDLYEKCKNYPAPPVWRRWKGYMDGKVALIVCPDCLKTQVSRGMKRCPECGKALDWSEFQEPKHKRKLKPIPNTDDELFQARRMQIQERPKKRRRF